MQSTASLATAEPDIRRLLDNWCSAAAAGDVDRIMMHYAPDILSFDAVAQLQFKGAEVYRKHWQACMEMCKKSTMIFEMHELAIAADDDLAFAHSLMRCGFVGDDGQEKTSWMRATTCLRRMSGKWLIVHEHFSAPFDMENSKAMLDLQP
jgi:uncharacterized protein (TIGR02246 family)